MVNILSSSPVLALVLRTIVTLIAPLCFLASCASQREIWQDMEIPTGRHEAGSAMNSDYLVRGGATLQADYARGSRFYVEKGGRLVLGRVRECKAYAESGALVDRSSGLGVRPVKSAPRAFADRNKPVLIKKGPGGVIPAYVLHRGSHDDEDDDDDDHDYHRDLPDNVSISGSSYRKKE